MQREIKFRAWDIHKKLFIPSDVYAIITTDFNAFGIMLKDWENYREGEYFYDNSQLISQYTGLKDKNGNGNDVFEGDIFEAIYKDCPDGFNILGKETTIIKVKAVVVFNFGKFVIKMMHPEYKELVYSDLFDFLKNEEKEIIGNIHQNPELLK